MGGRVLRSSHRARRNEDGRGKGERCIELANSERS